MTSSARDTTAKNKVSLGQNDCKEDDFLDPSQGIQAWAGNRSHEDARTLPTKDPREW